MFNNKLGTLCWATCATRWLNTAAPTVGGWFTNLKWLPCCIPLKWVWIQPTSLNPRDVNDGLICQHMKAQKETCRRSHGGFTRASSGLWADDFDNAVGGAPVHLRSSMWSRWTQQREEELERRSFPAQKLLFAYLRHHEDYPVHPNHVRRLIKLNISHRVHEMFTCFSPARVSVPPSFPLLYGNCS